MPYINGIFVVDHSYYSPTPFQNSAYSYHYQEPQLPPCTYIHPDSAAAQLGLTPEEMAPILEEPTDRDTTPPRTFNHTTRSYLARNNLGGNRCDQRGFHS